MRLNSRGFSLVEIMIASGVMVIVALGFATMMANGNKEMRYVETKMEAVQLRNQLALSMTNEKYCGCAFKGLTLDPTDATATVDPASFAVSYSDDGNCTNIGGAPIFESNKQIPSSKLFLGQMRVSGFVAGPAPGEYIGELVVPVDHVKTQIVRSFKDIKLPLRVTLDMAAAGADKPITTCTANLAAAAPSVAAFSSDYCYAIRAEKGGKGSCADGFYVKSIYTYDDSDWQGLGTVCCYGSTGNPPAAEIALIQGGAPVNVCVGCSYNTIVSNCNIDKTLYATKPNNTDCPTSPNISWGAWRIVAPCNAPAGCGSAGVETKQKTCAGSGCPNPATITRQNVCYDNSTCPPPEQP